MNAADFIGIPYNEANCYELVRRASESLFGVILPEVWCSDPDSISTASEVVAQHRPEWRQLDSPEPGALVLLRVKSVPVHCGLVLDHQWMLHSLAGHDSALERYTGMKWRSRLEGFFRYA